ncbi:unnamed protein product [Acanthosepion pharaonis]|uniref:Uncharacterized protein n=1 Tax=Acanthosepion pharaonis TaxID=158019 RepID=A0A812C4E7_ACAPH|nr:unnamed protein product [Sepia pharaonis]
MCLVNCIGNITGRVPKVKRLGVPWTTTLSPERKLAIFLSIASKALFVPSPSLPVLIISFLFRQENLNIQASYFIISHIGHFFLFHIRFPLLSFLLLSFLLSFLISPYSFFLFFFLSFLLSFFLNISLFFLSFFLNISLFFLSFLIFPFLSFFLSFLIFPFSFFLSFFLS